MIDLKGRLLTLTYVSFGQHFWSAASSSAHAYKTKKLELETNQPSSPSLLEASEDGQQ